MIFLNAIRSNIQCCDGTDYQRRYLNIRLEDEERLVDLGKDGGKLRNTFIN